MDVHFLTSTRSLLLTALVLLLTTLTVSAQAPPTDPFEIRLKNRRFTPDPGASLSGFGEDPSRREHILLQFNTLPTPEDLAALEENGIRILNYVPNNAVVASVPADFAFDAYTSLRWAGRLVSSDKLSGLVMQRIQEDDEQAITLVVEAFNDVGQGELANMVGSVGGEAQTHPSLPPYVQLVTGEADVFLRLAQEDAIAWMVPASDRLMQGDLVYWCPGPLTVYGSVAPFVAHDDGWDGPGMGSASLTYHFVNGTPDIAGSLEEIEVKKSFAEWATYVLLTFTETASAGLTTSLDILWGAGDHGDGFPFDGPGGVLAHAFFPAPPNPETIGGDMHFDEDETWSLTVDFHMFAVALHEAGHSLGLAHSDEPDAVMFAFYGGPLTGLHPDDIAGIRSIYATKTTGPVTRYVALPPMGSDAGNDCTIPATPCATIAHAVSEASSGDTLSIEADTYEEPPSAITKALFFVVTGVGGVIIE